MEQKQSNFLVTLLSILLIISCLIAGFFAYQTQKLVKEITKIKNVPTPVAIATPTPDLITSEKAAEIVRDLSEVKSFFNKTQNAKIALDESQNNDKFWTIQVYESFLDHNVTFNWYEVNKNTGEVKKKNQIACTADAKICPDGSSVGRTGPKCEFAACPTTSPLP